MRWLRRGLIALAVLWTSVASAAHFEQASTAHYQFEWSPGLEAPARALMASAEAHHARISEALGVSGAGQTRVTVLEDAEAMLAEATARHEGRPPPEWAEGLAYPGTREIFLHANEPLGAMDITFQHEIVHVALGELAGGRVPSWLHEGIAIRLSEGWSMDRAWLLTEASTMDALLDLDELSAGFPASGPRAGVAYAEAVHFVGYLESTFGQARFRALLKRLQESDSTLPEAIRATLGKPLGQIEDEWRRSLRIWWGWVPLVFGGTMMWGAAGLLLMLGWRRRRRMRVAQMDVLRAEEAAEMADLAADIEVAHGFEPPRRFIDPYDGRPPTIH